MQPFLLAFVDTQAFEILAIGFCIALGLGLVTLLVGLVMMAKRLYSSWRWWQELDTEIRRAVTRRYLLRKAKELTLLATVVGVMSLAAHLNRRAYEHSPANVFHPPLDHLRNQVAGEYTLADTLLSASARAAQQGQDGWSATTSSLPPATLVQLIIRSDGTFQYASNLPTDYTPAGEGTWQWLSLTGQTDKPASYGPVFYVQHQPSQHLWAVRGLEGFSFFGTYQQAGHEMPFTLTRQSGQPGTGR